jgi:hypothetical protein
MPRTAGLLAGFGARAAFGVRGVRLLQDDIPLTMPMGRVRRRSSISMGPTASRFLRGPFSALYGNSSGGVIHLLSALEAKKRSSGQAGRTMRTAPGVGR